MPPWDWRRCASAAARAWRLCSSGSADGLRAAYARSPAVGRGSSREIRVVQERRRSVVAAEDGQQSDDLDVEPDQRDREAEGRGPGESLRGAGVDGRLDGREVHDQGEGG